MQKIIIYECPFRTYRVNLTKKINDHTFIGNNYKAPWGKVFGGQVLAQSLYAAYQTVPKDRFVHSMHAYFILGGDLNIPIKYEVDMIRDGEFYTTTCSSIPK